jgi:hypothetical protein
MISILDLLKSRLGGASQYGVSDFEQPLPPGLPDAVRRSIQGQPSYAEGEILAPHQWYNRAFENEPWRPEDSPERRENQLSAELGFNRFFRREGEWSVPEGSIMTLLPPGRSPFAESFSSSLNQMLRRGPFALY